MCQRVALQVAQRDDHGPDRSGCAQAGEPHTGGVPASQETLRANLPVFPSAAAPRALQFTRPAP